MRKRAEQMGLDVEAVATGKKKAPAVARAAPQRDDDAEDDIDPEVAKRVRELGALAI